MLQIGTICRSDVHNDASRYHFPGDGASDAASLGNTVSYSSKQV